MTSPDDLLRKRMRKSILEAARTFDSERTLPPNLSPEEKERLKKGLHKIDEEVAEVLAVGQVAHDKFVSDMKKRIDEDAAEDEKLREKYGLSRKLVRSKGKQP